MASRLFGDFYEEKVLTFAKLKEKELIGSVCAGETELVQDLFGWKIVLGKHQIDCNSELEARFVRVFTELGWRSVQVPQDENYLAKILPELEANKQRADNLYKKREKTIFSRKLRREVKMKYYRRISKNTVEYQATKSKSKTIKSVEIAN